MDGEALLGAMKAYSATARLRWTLVLACALTAGCASFPQPAVERSTPEASARLQSAADGHGWSAYRNLKDISVSYDGNWFGAVGRLQPVLVDREFRGSSEERMLIASNEIGQTHRGPGGVKQVARAPTGTSVWYNAQLDSSPDKALAAGLVADGYRLFLLGPIYLLERDAIVEDAGVDYIDGAPHERLFARLRPGLGHAGEDRVMLWIDRASGLTRRIWISADALPTTQGVIAEIDLLDYRQMAGVNWPTRFFERLKRPFPLDVHQWRLVGLDVNRGYTAADILGPEFHGAASRPATRLPPADGRSAERLQPVRQVHRSFSCTSSRGARIC